MALDAVMFPQDPFGYNCTFKGYFQGMEDDISGGITEAHSWSYTQLGHNEEQNDKSVLAILDNKKNTNLINWLESSLGETSFNDQWVPNSNSSPKEVRGLLLKMPIEEEQKIDQPLTNRRKRRRTKTNKNKEEVENQRMTHIAVERNRRKQMNEYLAVLRSLIPSSYVQRGDQASVIGGAINFVKELEQLLQTLETEKSRKNKQQEEKPQEENNNETILSAFASFFTFPQYTTRATAIATPKKENKLVEDQCKASASADIEVTMVESHANVKILAKRCSSQLVKLVSTFQSLRLAVQHLNVSSLDHMVLYSVSVKVEEGCKLNSVDEIATAVNEMLHKIEEGSSC